jgi:ABC-type multidrug transport system ATPase subunit
MHTGKSTTIAMLAGLTPATAGSTSVRGIAVCSGAAAASQSLQQLRQHLGVCPQHDILFPQLTVMQHLLLYAAVKGLAWGERAVEAKKVTRLVQSFEQQLEHLTSLLCMRVVYVYSCCLARDFMLVSLGHTARL